MTANDKLIISELSRHNTIYQPSKIKTNWSQIYFHENKSLFSNNPLSIYPILSTCIYKLCSNIFKLNSTFSCIYFNLSNDVFYGEYDFFNLDGDYPCFGIFIFFKN